MAHDMHRLKARPTRVWSVLVVLAVGIPLLADKAIAPVLAVDVTPRNPSFANIEAAVEALRLEHDVPGVSVAVIHRGQIVHARAYGHLSRASREPVTRQTPFQTCSLSKPLVAVALMGRVERVRARTGCRAPPRAYGRYLRPHRLGQRHSGP